MGKYWKLFQFLNYIINLLTPFNMHMESNSSMTYPLDAFQFHRSILHLLSFGLRQQFTYIVQHVYVSCSRRSPRCSSASKNLSTSSAQLFFTHLADIRWYDYISDLFDFFPSNKWFDRKLLWDVVLCSFFFLVCFSFFSHTSSKKNLQLSLNVTALFFFSLLNLLNDTISIELIKYRKNHRKKDRKYSKTAAQRKEKQKQPYSIPFHSMAKWIGSIKCTRIVHC